MKVETDVLIIGGGITGASIARELSQYDVEIILAEKSPDTFTGQTKSGHGFVYSPTSLNNAYSLVLKSIMAPNADLWEPETLKTKLGILGFEKFKKLAKYLEIPYLPMKLVAVAKSSKEIKGLEKLYDITKKMGINEDVKWMDKEEISKFEPSISKDVIGGLYEEKWSNIIFPPDYALANIDNAKMNGVETWYDAEVIDIKRLQDGFITNTKKGKIYSKIIINAAGLYADKIADMANARDDWDIVLYRTQMVLLDGRLKKMFTNTTCVLGPVTPGFFEGICLQPHGQPYIFCGAYNSTEDKEARETRTEWFEESIVHGQKLMPGFSRDDVITSFTGIRAFNSRDPEDHILEFSKNNKNFFNAIVRLPGFSVSAGMAEYVVDLLGNNVLSLTRKNNYIKNRIAIPKYSDLSDVKKNDIIKKNNKYGDVICRCETVTEAEINEAIEKGARTIQGVQFRTRAGMGRCQRNFCGMKVVKLLSDKLGIPVEKITKYGAGSQEVY